MTTDRPELDAEQEVDFGRYWRAIAARWWLALGGLVAGLLIGYLVSLETSSTTYKATAGVYIGQQFPPGGSEPIVSVQTNLGFISSVLTAESTIRRVASTVGLKPARLRDHITLEPILGVTVGQPGSPSVLLGITVRGSPPRKIAAAANRLAAIVLGEGSGYTRVKIQALGDRLAFDNRELVDVNTRIDRTLTQQAALLTDKGLDPAEKLIASVNFNNLLTFLEARQASLERDQIEGRQLLSIARDIERGRIFSRAVAAKTAGPSSRTGAAVGGLIGLVLGILAALLWEPVAARARAGAES